MPRTRKDSTVQARLALDDFIRFGLLAKAEKKTKGQLAREALLFYMASKIRDKHDKPDRVIAEEIDRLSTNQVNATRQMAEEIDRATRKMADRICGMLAKIHTNLGTDLGVILELHAELESDERIADLMSKSAKRVGRKLSAEEKELRDRMSKVVRGDNP